MEGFLEMTQIAKPGWYFSYFNLPCYVFNDERNMTLSIRYFQHIIDQNPSNLETDDKLEYSSALDDKYLPLSNLNPTKDIEKDISEKWEAKRTWKFVIAHVKWMFSESYFPIENLDDFYFYSVIGMVIAVNRSSKTLYWKGSKYNFDKPCILIDSNYDHEPHFKVRPSRRNSISIECIYNHECGCEKGEQIMMPNKLLWTETQQTDYRVKENDIMENTTISYYNYPYNGHILQFKDFCFCDKNIAKDCYE